jgi:release factor glutamine methyltransferase
MQRTWTTRALLAWTAEHLEKQGVDSPRVSAEMLLSHVLGVPRLKLYMEPDRPASPEEREQFRGLVQRAGKHEPVDYLVGFTPFFAMEFKVSPAVLIPRPSTETLIEYVLQNIRSRDQESPLRIADICTGSGAIAIALAKHLPNAQIIATDISENALTIAQENAQTHGVSDRIDFRQGNLLEPIEGERFDYLLSNPPYISDTEWQEVAPNVRDYEPTLALRAGEDGLDLIHPLIAEAANHLLPDGKVLIEIAASQDRVAVGLAEKAGLLNIDILQDHDRLPRVIVGSIEK